MVKAAVITPLYLSVAWTLMVSYQLFTETAVTSVLTQVNVFLPSASVWLAARTDMIIFIYAFAWVFLLSSVIPSAILGKERSVIAQFIVCLTLTLSAFVLLDVLENFAGNPLAQLLGYSFLFTNPIIAALYLAVPYIFMIGIDLRARNIRKREKESLAEIEENELQTTTPLEQNSQEADLIY